MHRMVLVVGADVEAQMNGLMTLGNDEQCGWDWWAVGGRYTGTLPLKPGRTGKTFGDAVPPFEQALAATMPEGVTMQRGSGDMTGDGVDQARAGDVDLQEVGASGVVQDGRLVLDSEDIISPEATVVMMTANLARQYLDRGEQPPFDPPEDARCERAGLENEAWLQKLQGFLRALPATALLTVVDVHS